MSTRPLRMATAAMNARQRVLDVVGTSKAAARIRAGAIELFAAHGYGSTSLRDIAAHVGLSPGAVYPHYKTKESLLFAIAIEGHASVLAAVTAADSQDRPPIERLTAAVIEYVVWHADNHLGARVVQYELRSLSDQHFKAVASLRRATSDVFADIVETGHKSGDFRPVDVDATVLAITSLGIDVSRWFPTRKYSDPAALAAQYSELTLLMVGAKRRSRR